MASNIITDNIVEEGISFQSFARLLLFSKLFFNTKDLSPSIYKLNQPLQSYSSMCMLNITVICIFKYGHFKNTQTCVCSVLPLISWTMEWTRITRAIKEQLPALVSKCISQFNKSKIDLMSQRIRFQNLKSQKNKKMQISSLIE